MTKFEELMDLIGRNKNKKISRKIEISEHERNNNMPESDDNEDIELEVSGSETRGPLVAAADDQLDPDIIDMLYTKNWRNIPNRGENASSWDSDY
jgi:hypothetical protein